MTEGKSPEPRSVPYPRLTNCPKCNGQLDPTGWCYACARRRQGTIAALLIFATPALSFGACWFALASNQFYILGTLAFYAFFLGPIMGVIYVLVASVSNKNRRK